MVFFVSLMPSPSLSTSSAKFSIMLCLKCSCPMSPVMVIWSFLNFSPNASASALRPSRLALVMRMNVCLMTRSRALISLLMGRIFLT